MIKLAHITTGLQPADMFTKSFNISHESFFCRKLGVCNFFHTSDLRENVIEEQATASLQNKQH